MIENQRHRFDIPDAITYLNCASQTPLLRDSATAGQAGLTRKAQPWGSGRADAAAEAERARALFGGLIGATADDIAIVPATSYGVAVAAANLPVARGQEIVVLEEQFPSNYHAWRVLAAQNGARLVTVPRPGDGDWTAAVLEHLRAATAIAALPHCHWTDGGWLDLAAIGARVREFGAALVIDATQHAGAAPLDVAASQPDFLVCSAYKWLPCPLYPGVPLRRAAPSAGPADRTSRRFRHRRRAALRHGRAAQSDQPADGRGGAGPAAALDARIAEGASERGFTVAPEAHRAAHYIGLRGGAIRVSPYLFTAMNDIDRFFAVLDRRRAI